MYSSRTSAIEASKTTSIIACSPLQELLELGAGRRLADPGVALAGAQALADLVEEVLVGPVALLVLGADSERVEVALRAGVVEPLAEARAVGERDPQVGVGDVDVEAALLELELADHDVVEQADDVGAGADDEVGVGERALERAGAAEPLAALEDEHGLAGLGEVGGAGEAVVAAADDDGVPVLGGELADGCGEADLTELLCDRVHGEISLATASTTTAPSGWTSTGLHSTSSRPGSSVRRAASRAAAGRSAPASSVAPRS